jgi:16S rRNA (uracil1498-N3)-methyltransferase
VLRQRRGDRVVLFAGDGVGYDATIVAADARACTVHVGTLVAREAEPRVRLHLAQALIKGERLDFVLQKATELGVTDIWLTETERTEVHIEGPRVARRETHWHGVIIGAVEQCGRLRVPVLHAPQTLAAVLQRRIAAQTFLLEPGAAPLAAAPPADTLLLIGPEGGFSDAERQLALANGARSIGLGRFILRADTAPLAALTVLRQSWGWDAP